MADLSSILTNWPFKMPSVMFSTGLTVFVSMDSEGKHDWSVYIFQTQTDQYFITDLETVKKLLQRMQCQVNYLVSFILLIFHVTGRGNDESREFR